MFSVALSHFVQQIEILTFLFPFLKYIPNPNPSSGLFQTTPTKPQYHQLDVLVLRENDYLFGVNVREISRWQQLNTEISLFLYASLNSYVFSFKYPCLSLDLVIMALHSSLFIKGALFDLI